MNRAIGFSAMIAILAGCATTPAAMHTEAQLGPVAAQCGLGPDELVQETDLDGNGLLVVIRRETTAEQRSCVRQWAAQNHLKAAYVAMDRSKIDLNEGCEMFALLAATGSIVLVRVTPDYLPAINMNGTVQRVIGLTIKGPPEKIPALQQKVVAEGWKTHLADPQCMEVDPSGHSLDQVTALSFRVNNGEFGDMKLNFILRPNDKLRD